MPTVTELQETRGRLVTQAREALEAINSNTDESRTAELEGRHDTIMAEFDANEAAIAREERTAAAERRAEEARAQRRPTGPDVVANGQDNGDDEPVTHETAFRSFLRVGVGDLSVEERAILREHRAQAVGTDGAGGYTVPQGFVAELIKSLKMWGPMLDPGITRELVTASGNQLEIPTMNDTANQGVRLDENTVATSEGDVAFGQKLLDAYKYSSGPILVSNELIQDSAFNIEQVIRDAMAERIGRKVNADLTTGDGAGDPNGLVTASSLGKTAAGAATVTFDELIDLEHSVDPAYRIAPSCRWMFNDGTLKIVRKLKDGQGNYLWSPADARTGAPSQILMHAYSVNQAMPNMTTGLKSVLFGDFNKYIVRRVREFAVRRLVERYADYDQVGFIGFARYDGELLDTAAVKHLIQA
jgi:HK97 family phage major capsid protein